MAENVYENLYAPPAAVLVDYPKGRLRILEIPRFPTWSVLALAVLTLSLYVVYLLYSRTQVLNTVMPERRIVPAFFWTVIISLTNLSISRKAKRNDQGIEGSQAGLGCGSSTKSGAQGPPSSARGRGEQCRGTGSRVSGLATPDLSLGERRPGGASFRVAPW